MVSFSFLRRAIGGVTSVIKLRMGTIPIGQLLVKTICLAFISMVLVLGPLTMFGTLAVAFVLCVSLSRTDPRSALFNMTGLICL